MYNSKKPWNEIDRRGRGHYRIPDYGKGKTPKDGDMVAKKWFELEEWHWSYGIIIGDKMVGKYAIPIVHWQTGETSTARIDGLYLIKEAK